MVRHFLILNQFLKIVEKQIDIMVQHFHITNFYHDTWSILAAAKRAAVGLAIFFPAALSKVCFAPGSKTAKSER